MKTTYEPRYIMGSRTDMLSTDMMGLMVRIYGEIERL